MSNQPLPEGWTVGLWSFVSSLVTGIFTWIVRIEGRPKPKPLELQSIEVDRGRIQVLASVIDELQDERKDLRHNMANLQMRFDALDARLASTITKARLMEDMYARNMRRIWEHIEECHMAMRLAGIATPQPPVLEKEDH